MLNICCVCIPKLCHIHHLMYTLWVCRTGTYWSNAVRNACWENAEERKRLGYSVKIDNLGPPRLYPGGLACSRGIGDYDCPLLCWKPSTSYETLTSQTTLVLASDGIWDCLGTRRVLNTVRVTRHAKTVLRLRSQYTDDATIIVISKERPSPRFGITWFFKSGNGSASSSSEDEDDMIRYPVSLQ